MADAIGYACIALAKRLLTYTIGESGFRPSKRRKGAMSLYSRQFLMFGPGVKAGTT